MNHPDSNFNQSELEHRVTLDAQRIHIVMNSEQLRKNMDHTSSRPLGKKANPTQEGTGHRRGRGGRPRSVSRMAVWTQTTSRKG
jgi:hypothetical protein